MQFPWDLLSTIKTSLGRMRLLSFFGRMSKIFLHLPKNDIVWVSQESQVPSAYQVKKSWKWIIRGGIVRPRSHSGSSYYSPRTDTKGRLLSSATYYRKKWSLSFVVRLWSKHQKTELTNQFQSEKWRDTSSRGQAYQILYPESKLALKLADINPVENL